MADEKRMVSRRGFMKASAAVGLVALLVAGCGGPAATSGSGTAAPAAAQGKAPSIARQPFGTTADGTAVELFILDNGRGMKVRVITYGATIAGVDVPDRNGRAANVVLYGETLDQYEAGLPAASVIGRFANRIGGAKFVLDGVTYPLAANSGVNHIHGGKVGFDKVVWRGEPVTGDGVVGVRLTYTSRDGEEGYPGTLVATVTYRLTALNELAMEYTATTDKPTHVNLTNHGYWNLAGAGSGSVRGHRLTINADQWLPADAGLIPTGEFKDVAGTPVDFRRPETIGARIDLLTATGGYDHGYVVKRSRPGELALAARVVEPSSGRVMEVSTTYPSVQLYTANHLDGHVKVGGRAYEKYGAVCLETQFFPDSPNKPGFPSTVLRPGEAYRQLTVHRFSVE